MKQPPEIPTTEFSGQHSGWVSVGELAKALVGVPSFRRLSQEAKLTAGDEIMIRAGTIPARARWLVAHEIAEWYYRELGYSESDIEERCDALRGRPLRSTLLASARLTDSA